MQDTIIILDEGDRPCPRCPQCEIFVPQKDLNGRHLAIDFCRRGMKRKWRRLAEEEALEGAERELTAYGVPLYQVTSFKYLGRVLAA